MDVWVVGWMDGWVGGWVSGWMDGISHQCPVERATCVKLTGEEGSGADEAWREGGAAQRVRVSEAREAAVDGSTAGQLAQEGRKNRTKVAVLTFRNWLSKRDIWCHLTQRFAYTVHCFWRRSCQTSIYCFYCCWARPFRETRPVEADTLQHCVCVIPMTSLFIYYNFMFFKLYFFNYCYANVQVSALQLCRCSYECTYLVRQYQSVNDGFNEILCILSRLHVNCSSPIGHFCPTTYNENDLKQYFDFGFFVTYSRKSQKWPNSFLHVR